ITDRVPKISMYVRDAHLIPPASTSPRPSLDDREWDPFSSPPRRSPSPPFPPSHAIRVGCPPAAVKALPAAPQTPHQQAPGNQPRSLGEGRLQKTRATH